MGPKEQEGQLNFSLNSRIVINVLLTLAYFVMVVYWLRRVGTPPSALQVQSGVNVPTLKTNNFNVIGENLKPALESATRPNSLRTEPFD